MFKALLGLVESTVKIADAVVSVPCSIVNAVVVKPLASAAEAIKDTVDDLID